MIFSREQLWLFRGIHFHYAESVGEKVMRYEFAVKIPEMADDAAERSQPFPTLPDLDTRGQVYKKSRRISELLPVKWTVK